MNTYSNNFGSNTLTLPDTSACEIMFNVMPGRPVRECLSMSEFRVGPNWIEGEFDRTYDSAMLNSPSHLTFIAALIQMQKLTYVYSCCRLGLDSNPANPEVLKVWPTNVSVSMRDLVKEERLVHRMEFTGYRKLESRKYLATAASRIGQLQIDANAIIHVLDNS